MRQRRHQKRNKKLRLILLLAVVAACLCVTLAQGWDDLYRAAGLKNTPADGALSVQILDAGNADCAVVTLGEETLLIDAGLPAFGDDLCAYLNKQGIEDLDYVIATHTHNDHIGGMPEVVETVPIEQFLTSPLPDGKKPTTQIYSRLTGALKQQNVAVTEVTAGMEYAFGGATIHILSPQDDSGDTNNQSVVCRIVYGEDSFLFMGDAEEPVEKQLLQSGAVLRSDFLKVGHHGSRTASSSDFLSAVRPELAVIPCGEGNSYGHPHSEVLQLLEKLKIPHYRSDLHGNITVISNGKGLTVTAERQAAS